MSRKVRDANLQTRQARLKLMPNRRYWKGIEEGLALGYRRGPQGVGSWSMRLLLSDGRYALRAIADADDLDPSDGVRILNLSQAQDAAIALAREISGDHAGMLTFAAIARAAKQYLAWFDRHMQATRDESVADRIPLAFRTRRLTSLRAQDLDTFLALLMKQPRRGRTAARES